MPENAAKKSGQDASSVRQSVVNAAKAYVDRGNPYTWGGKGQALTDANVSSLAQQYSNKNDIGWYDHVKPGGSWYSKVNQEGQQCVDCSGLTQTVFKNTVGIDIGCGTGSQLGYGADVGLANAQPGDLLVRDGHAAIMGNNGKMIEAQGRAYGCTYNRAPSSDMKAIRVVNGGSAVTSSGTTAVASAPAAATAASWSSFDVNSAVSYNRRQSYSASTWMKIQSTVGTTPDGDPGRKTANAVCEWQRANGLTPDGCCGPKTYAALQAYWNGASTTASTQQATSTQTTANQASSGNAATTTSVNINVDAAVKYNRGRAYTQECWMEIQTKVGTTPDGQPGKNTANAIAVYQKNNGLEVDGKCGKCTLASMGITPKYPSGTDGSAQNQAVQYAAQFVGKEYPELFSLIPTLEDTRSWAGCNGGHTNNCANFVSAILRPFNLLNSHEVNVTSLRIALENMGYRSIDKASTKPGDVYITNGEGHTELVYSNGASQLIGSNNYKQGYQACSIASPSAGASYYTFRNS